MSQSQQDNTEQDFPYHVGAVAGREGKEPTDNPYPVGDKHNAWMLGWAHYTNEQNLVVNPLLENRKMARVSTLMVKRFNSPFGFRLWGWGLVLRLALLTGHPVVLIGACRTGKTLLLGKLTPGQIIDKRDDAMQGKSPALNESDVPSGVYSLDECQLFEPNYLVKLTTTMATQNRAFCLAAQRYCDVKKAVDAYRLSEAAKRVVLVVVGGAQNPPSVLRELLQ